MDFSRHIPRWLTTARVELLGGQYEGIVDAVTEEPIRNRHTGETRLEPVITFRDGERTIPNIGQRRALCEALGTETSVWIGRVVRIFLKPLTSGRGVRFERAIMVVGDPVRMAPPRTIPSETEVRSDEIFMEEGFVRQ